MRKSKIKIDPSLTSQDFSETFSKTTLPIVPVSIDSKTYNFLVDSGSDTSYIDSSVCDQIPKTLIGHQVGIYGAGSISDNKIPVFNIDFSCGPNKYTERFTSNDFSGVFGFIAHSSGINVHGILGSRFLSEHSAILDFGSKTLYV